MVSPELSARSPDRGQKRRPFATWVKKLANLKTSDVQTLKKNGKKAEGVRHKNNPYPESGYIQTNAPPNRHSAGVSYASAGFSRTSSRSAPSVSASDVVNDNATYSNRSTAPTVETNPDTVHSDAGHSRAFTTKTGGAVSSMDGAAVNSTFSSPNHSDHSLTTTLTTIHSTSPGNILSSQSQSGPSNSAPPTGNSLNPSGPHYTPNGTASALPPHLAPNPHPSTYSSATANNLLTDDASIMTLASSSKRRRRRSMDTDASVRALAPSSVWGGSRESLPLSVLSGNTDIAPLASPNYTSTAGRPLASAERASIYSSHSVAAPALVSDRNSYYATSLKQSIRDKDRDKDARSIDGRSLHRDADDQKSLHGGKSLYDGVKAYESSIKSGALGHGRNDSNAGSINYTSAGPANASVRALDASSLHGSTHRVDEDDGDGELD